MSDTAITTHLEELREVDETTWAKIQYGVVFGKGLDESRVPYESMGVQMAHDHLQGCIQRAIAAREWGTTQVSHATWETGSRYICQIRLPGPFPLDFYGTATAPAAAILAAYIEAVRARQ